MTMTSKSLIKKLLANGFVKSGENEYAKQLDGCVGTVAISEYDSATEGNWFMPFLIERTQFGEGRECSWSAAGLNQIISRRGYFK